MTLDPLLRYSLLEDRERIVLDFLENEDPRDLPLLYLIELLLGLEE